MEKLDPRFFIGKTIIEMVTDAINVTYIKFDDGSSCSVWAECESDGLPFLYMDDIKE